MLKALNQSWITICLVFLSVSAHALPQKSGMTARDFLSIPSGAMHVALQNETENSELKTELKNIALDKKQNYSLRWKALSALTDLQNTSATPTLLLACRSSEWFMKNSCMMNLHRIKSPESVPQSMALLQDPALVVRSQAVEVLIADGNPTEIRNILWTELDQPRNFRKNKSLWIRKQILEFLSKKPLLSERSQWMQLTYDQDQKIKKVAQSALTTIK